MRRAFLLSIALVPAAAGADQVLTRSGGRLDGEIVERRADSILVDVGGGTIELPLAYVERIVPGPTPIAAYRRRAQRLAPDDTAGWVALGHWARGQELRAQADEAFLRALSRDPDDVAANQALGHVKVGDRWMTREESAEERGLVSFEGRWMALEERRELMAERAAAAEQVQAEIELFAQVRESEARAREAEAQARVAEAEARIAEEDAERTESAGIGIQWVPLGSGLVASHGRYRSFSRACHWRSQGALRPFGAMHVPGRGGALMVSGDLRPVGRR